MSAGQSLVIGLAAVGVIYVGLCTALTVTSLQTSGFYAAHDIGVNIGASIGITLGFVIAIPMGLGSCHSCRHWC